MVEGPGRSLRLRRWREEFDYSLEQVANWAGVSIDDLAAIESGRAEAPRDVQECIRELFAMAFPHVARDLFELEPPAEGRTARIREQKDHSMLPEPNRAARRLRERGHRSLTAVRRSPRARGAGRPGPRRRARKSCSSGSDPGGSDPHRPPPFRWRRR
jgi:predicted transcriptional regulator